MNSWFYTVFWVLLMPCTLSIHRSIHSQTCSSANPSNLITNLPSETWDLHGQWTWSYYILGLAGKATMIGWRKKCHNPTPSGLILQDIPTRKFWHLLCLSNISLVHFRTRACMNQTPSYGQFQIRPKTCFSKTMVDASISKCHHTSYEIWGRLGPRTTASTQVLQRPGVDHREGHHPRIGSGWRNLELTLA